MLVCFQLKGLFHFLKYFLKVDIPIEMNLPYQIEVLVIEESRLEKLMAGSQLP